MKIREKVRDAMKGVEEKFVSQFGFHMKDASLSNFVDYMHQPKDSSSLAVTRILFGICMLFDISEERGGAVMEARWGDPNTCHFPLVSFIQAIPMPYMAAVYAGLWYGAVGITSGHAYRVSAAVFTVCYWYLFLIEKSYWNNHSYLFGLVALLLTFTDANCYWSLDAYLDPSKSKTTVPYWNYFILKYQFFILYFMAGLKKGTPEWLTGYSVQNLSKHWVFGPFKYFMSVPQIDYYIVHWFIFVFDLTVAIWMMCSRSRHVAMVFCALFHLMNSRLFRIGMFPWVCLATMPLFYPFDWPKVLLRKFKFHITRFQNKILSRLLIIYGANRDCTLTAEENDEYLGDTFVPTAKVSDAKELRKMKKKNQKLQKKQRKGVQNNDNTDDSTDVGDTDSFEESNENKSNSESENTRNEPNKNRQRLIVYLITFYVAVQAFLPYSHFITKGFNNWTNGLYGYSWDMMVHTWDTYAVIVKVVDNEKEAEYYVDPNTHTPNERWTRHNDMVYQYAKCLNQKFIEKAAEQSEKNMSQNLSIYIDVWCSLNGRFTQRHFDPKADMLKVEWSPFKSSSYLMPMLDEALNWREELAAIRDHVHIWHNDSDVVFIADFPGYVQENYISPDLRNVTLTILEGEVVYEPPITQLLDGHSYKLTTGESIPIHTGNFHKVLNIGQKPAYYMYTFHNSTAIVPKDSVSVNLPIFTELFNRLFRMFNFLHLLVENFGKIFTCFYNCA